VLLILALAACTGSSGSRCVETLTPERPGWLAAAPKDTDAALLRVGRSEDPAMGAAIKAAEKDAARQLVEQHYGTVLERDYQQIRTELQTRVVEQLSSSAEGAVAGTRQREVYWERCRTDGAGFTFRASVLVEADRKTFAEAVRRYIEASPKVVEARAIAAESRRLLETHSRAAAQGLETDKRAEVAREYAEMIRTGRALDQREARYRRLLGRDLPLARWHTDKNATALREKAATLRAATRVAISAGDDRLRTALAAATEGLGLSVVAGGCRKGVTLALRAVAKEPACEDTGMHTQCELVVAVEVRDCAARKRLEQAQFRGASTRGAAMSVRDATAKAWRNLGGQNQALLRAEIASVLGRHVPMHYDPGRSED